MNKLTSGSLNYDIYLRIPAGGPPVIVVTNGVYYVPAGGDYDTATGRVHVRGSFTSGAGANSIVVTYGNSDYDGDGLLDSYEVSNGLSPVDSTGVNGAPGDPDGDGMTNEQEQAAGTQANNANSRFRITNIARLLSGDTVVIWDSVATKNYFVQSTDNLSNAFANLSAQITAAGASTGYTNSTAVNARFYRVRLVP